jgi:hypothetical protein
MALSHLGLKIKLHIGLHSPDFLFQGFLLGLVLNWEMDALVGMGSVGSLDLALDL